ncbi:hypothetical protein BOX15_Mlig028965g1, partial [Macrostomum lignano]
TGGRKAYYRCCVAKCGQTSSSAPELCFHRIIRDQTRREFWLANMRCTEEDITNSSRICGDHFTYYDYEDFEANKLRKVAVPTLFAWEPIYTSQDAANAISATKLANSAAVITVARAISDASAAAAAAAAAAVGASSAVEPIEIDDDEIEIIEQDCGQQQQQQQEQQQQQQQQQQEQQEQQQQQQQQKQQRVEPPVIITNSNKLSKEEYEQLLLLVSVSERLENAHAGIVSELAEMQRVQRRQDRLMDLTLEAVMRPEFPLALSKEERDRLTKLRTVSVLPATAPTREDNGSSEHF